MAARDVEVRTVGGLMWVVVGCSVAMGVELSSACAWCWRAKRGSKFWWWGVMLSGVWGCGGRPGPQTLVINRWDIKGDRRRLVEKREIEL